MSPSFSLVSKHSNVVSVLVELRCTHQSCFEALEVWRAWLYTSRICLETHWIHMWGLLNCDWHSAVPVYAHLQWLDELWTLNQMFLVEGHCPSHHCPHYYAPHIYCSGSKQEGEPGCLYAQVGFINEPAHPWGNDCLVFCLTVHLRQVWQGFSSGT